eukprot:scaffold1472_cov310-Prasinococcus_capsulatus_cf.AAC.4
MPPPPPPKKEQQHASQCKTARMPSQSLRLVESLHCPLLTQLLEKLLLLLLELGHTITLLHGLCSVPVLQVTLPRGTALCEELTDSLLRPQRAQLGLELSYLLLEGEHLRGLLRAVSVLQPALKPPQAALQGRQCGIPRRLRAFMVSHAQAAVAVVGEGVHVAVEVPTAGGSSRRQDAIVVVLACSTRGVVLCEYTPQLSEGRLGACQRL